MDLKEAIAEAMSHPKSQSAQSVAGRVLVDALAAANEENGRLREALRIYADETEWRYSDPNKDPWQLLFNSTEMDGHGWERASQALKGRG